MPGFQARTPDSWFSSLSSGTATQTPPLTGRIPGGCPTGGDRAGLRKGVGVEPPDYSYLNSLFGFDTPRLIWARGRTGSLESWDQVSASSLTR